MQTLNVFLSSWCNQAGEGKNWGTEESVFNRIMVMRSPAHLKALFQEYTTVSQGKEIEESIEGEFSSDIKDAYLAIGM